VRLLLWVWWVLYRQVVELADQLEAGISQIVISFEKTSQWSTVAAASWTIKVCPRDLLSEEGPATSPSKSPPERSQLAPIELFGHTVSPNFRRSDQGPRRGIELRQSCRDPFVDIHDRGLSIIRAHRLCGRLQRRFRVGAGSIQHDTLNRRQSVISYLQVQCD
jgi:hypothetical protein